MIAKVIVDISTSEIDNVFDYEIPSSLAVGVGDRVSVPFANRVIEGFVIEKAETSSSKYTLKSIISRLDAFTAITPEMIELIGFMREKYHVRFIDVLRLCIPSGMRGGKIKESRKFYLSLRDGVSEEEIRRTVPKRAKSRLEIIERLRNGSEEMKVLGTEYSASAIKALIDQGIIVKSSVSNYRKPYEKLDSHNGRVTLTKAQSDALAQIKNDDRSVVLLHGVTGSGKTEIYMNLIEETLDSGKSAIMLVPEISLTPQMLRLFRGRFGDTVAMLHSGLTQGEKYDEWRRLLSGDARIAVGARSAVFAPLQNVGVIIIDEEHDASYISETNPRYQTIDVAEFRGRYNGAKVVIGSATPSIETYKSAKDGVYGLVTLDKRVNAKEMPKLEIIDMSKEIMEGNIGIFSRKLKDKLTETVNNGNQAIIFLNRRGYSSFVMCKKCGYVAKCEDCDVSLTYHIDDNMLKCHYCGRRYKMLTECPECGNTELRHGKIGTERVVNEIREFLPDATVLRMDNDTTATKTAYLDILGAFRSREADILVGTQMIAKGHDFPNVTLVGILDADMSLYFSDYRSAERTFQLVTQVAGRAGRSDKQGEVMLQTFSPKHYVFRYAETYNYRGFFEKENNTREITKFPPYTKIARILMTSLDEKAVVDTAKNIYTAVKEVAFEFKNDFVYLQAMKAPVKRIENKFRYQIIMRLTPERADAIIGKINGILDDNIRKNVWTFLEINPQNMN